MPPRRDDPARPPIRRAAARDNRGRTRSPPRGEKRGNLGSLAAVLVAAACAASIAPRGASAQFLSVPDTFLSSTDPSAPCPVDVDRLRLDPTLGQACDANVQGDRLCEACVCDIALRLAEAGYAVAGPDAVPFQACAFQNLLALQQRGGITIGGMLEVSRRCDYAPPCINEISEDFFGDETTDESPAPAPSDAMAPTASILRTQDDVDPDCEGQGCVLAGLVAAAPRADTKSTSSAGAGPPNVFAASIAVPIVFACFAAWLVAFCVGRGRRRKRLASAAVGAATDDGETDRVGVGELTFRDVVVVAGGGKGGKGGTRLLDGVSGTCHRGEILGLLGPSGAGKSTLLNVIAGRVDLVRGMRQTEGTVRLDGAAKRSRHLSKSVAYVPQHDTHLLPYLTVYETCMYSAELQLPWFTSTADKRAKALAVLEELNLLGVANSRVGAADGGGKAPGSRRSSLAKAFGGSSAVGGICRGTCVSTDDGPSVRTGGAGTASVSGGERRRVSVAMELVTSPDVLVLDEPTSGLDAAAASAMVQTLRSLASRGRGRVVIFSVHQPSPRAFRAIDRVMLLGPGGKRLWCGAPRDAEGFFTAAGLPCPEENLFNLGASSSTSEPNGPDAGLHADALVAGLTLPDRGYRVDVSEWMLEVASCPARVAALAAATAADCAEPPRTSAPSSPSSTSPVPPPDAHSTAAASPSRHRSWITETRVLLGRAGKTVARDPTLLVAHLLVALVTAAVLGWLYLNSPKSLAGFQNRAGGMFFTLVFFGLASLSAADRLAAESAVRAREIQSGYHGAGSYVVSALVTDVLCLRVPAAAAYAAVFYFLMGLKPEASAFFVFLGVLELFVMCTAAMSSLISLCFDAPAVANLIATSVQLLGAMFGGFLVSIQNVAPYLRWIQWVSVYRYAWGAMLASEMDDQTFLFDVDDFEGARVTMQVSGQTYLNTFALDPRNVNRDILALAAMFVLLAGACWLRLHVRFAMQRRRGGCFGG